MPFNTNAFPKQTGYLPKLSQSAGTADPSAGQDTVNKDAGSGTSPTGRRRSTEGSAKFSGLSDYKRNSQDGNARKNSFNEMKKEGLFGGMWDTFTKGAAK